MFNKPNIVEEFHKFLTEYEKYKYEKGIEAEKRKREITEEMDAKLKDYVPRSEYLLIRTIVFTAAGAVLLFFINSVLGNVWPK